MTIKTFAFPSFEGWVKKGSVVRVELGAYCCEIRAYSWGNNSTIYKLAASYVDRNPLNIYSPQIFSRRFEDFGDNEKLKKWYDEVTLEFNSFWKNLVISTYIEEE